jgi:hypothetical protein
MRSGGAAAEFDSGTELYKRQQLQKVGMQARKYLVCAAVGFLPVYLLVFGNCFPSAYAEFTGRRLACSTSSSFKA